MHPAAPRSAQRLPLPACLLMLLLLAPAHTSPRPATPDLGDNAQRFEKVWTTTRDHFYDRTMRGLDWQAVGDRYRERATAAKTSVEFSEVVNRMLGELHASHLGYVTDDEMEFNLLQSVFTGDMKGLQMDHIGVMGARENGAFTVHAVLEGGPADLAGVHVGDRLLAAGGRPFSTVGAFRGRAGESVPLELDRPGAGRRTLTVTPARQNPQQAFLESTRRSVRILSRGGRRLGYIHLWCMTNPAFREALDSALTGRLADTDGLVLDLRDGFGGHPFGYADVLFRPDVEWSDGARGRPPHVSHTGYAKPMVLLVNGGTRSAKEYFAYQIQKSGRGALVGTRTAGAFLGANGYRIGSDGYLELPVMDLKLDGRRLEGIGIAPDVEASPDDPYGPRDSQLSRGLDVLLARLRAPVATGAFRAAR